MKKVLGAGLLCTLLLLAACGGDDTATPEAVATEAATPTAEAVVEATATTAMSETEGLTDTESMTGTEDMTGSEALTNTDDMTDTEGVTGAGALTGTMGMTGTEGLTGTEGMSDTAGMEEAPRQLIRATDLQGYDVQNAAGESLGSVQDVVMNLADGQILLVTVEYGGFLDIGDKVFPIPLSAFRFERDTDTLVEPSLGADVALTDTVGLSDAIGMSDTAGLSDTLGLSDTGGLTDTALNAADIVLILDIPEETFQNAPGIDEDLDLTGSDSIGGIETFYRDLGEDVIGRPIAETDLEAVTGNAVKLSDIQGSNVQNPAGEGVGEVNDMLIDLGAGRVEYFILEFGGFLGIGDNEYAIPMEAFDVIPTSADVADGFPTLVLDVTEEQLSTAPVFDANTLGNPDWDLDSRDFWLPNGN